MTSSDPAARPPVSSAAAKAALRAAVLARRDTLPADWRAEAAHAAAGHVAALPFLPGCLIAGYSPIGAEIDPGPLLRALSGRGHPLALPVLIDRETIEFRRWQPGDPLVPAGFGTQGPPAGAEVVAPDGLVVPLVGFDATGHRLGWGKGHYDRAIARLAPRCPLVTVGLAFSVQQLPAVPAEPHDRRLDMILTERGPVRPGGARE